MRTPSTVGLPRWLRSGPPWRRTVVLVSAAVILGVAVGVGVAGSPLVGLGLAGFVFALGIYLADPIIFVVIVLPGSILVSRLGGGGTNLSIADALGFVGGVICLFHIRWSEAAHLKRFCVGIVWYQASLILVVLAHPNHYDIVEWLHRLSYLGASVLCGWVIAVFGRQTLALRLYLWASAVLAVEAMQHAVSLHFQPAQWGDYQKNELGSVFWVAIVLAQLNPPWTGIGRREAQITKWVCVLGLLAAQSRQAIVTMLVAFSLAALLNPDTRQQAKIWLLGAIPLVVGLYLSFENAAVHNAKFNSVATRLDQISAAVSVWHLSPIFGQGLRFYYLPQFLYVTAPPNVLIDNLSSTGILGSVTFFFLVGVTVWALWKLPRQYGTLALAILVGRYIDGLFDIFWTGAVMITPFVLCGICLGMADRDRRAPVTAASLRASWGSLEIPSGLEEPAEELPKVEPPRQAVPRSAPWSNRDGRRPGPPR